MRSDGPCSYRKAQSLLALAGYCAKVAANTN